MTLKQLDTLDSIRKFLEGNQRVAFSALGSKPERYRLIRKTLVDFVYYKASKPDKGLLRKYDFKRVFPKMKMLYECAKFIANNHNEY